jgi:hypothetical protein
MGGTCSIHGETRNIYRILVKHLKGRAYLGDPAMNGRILLKWAVRVWTRFSWFRIESDVGPL